MALENQFYIYYRREHPCSLGRLDPNCTMNFESVLDLDFNISFLGSLLKIWISGTSLELLRCTNGRSLETCILNSSCNFARWATVWQQKQHMGTHTHTHMHPCATNSQFFSWGNRANGRGVEPSRNRHTHLCDTPAAFATSPPPVNPQLLVTREVGSC